MTRRRSAAELADIEDEVQHLLKTEGLKAAAVAMIAVCTDPAATAQAKATASRTIFEVTGSLKKEPPKPDKPASEMTIEELNALIARIDRQLDEIEASRTYDDDAEDQDPSVSGRS